ncbi:pirin [Oleiphilus sp. HI0071]|uniref:pirin family protein n=1 Tax=unclassified Oleiphilus TaxID=2631174 RepID=UPI0007C22C61|nr:MULTISPECIES: pirin family protein [unclassified Oleiphilus]KZY63717.1 pirin [Oleiphilus sp. HI0065]KZY86507.1 pirin [Oleiphilus sp. HI0071]KZZ06063.1 pirin [Oleiphilus sp. HI0073]KZZ41754.1 pirin [Oleiphilus sp. HI0118]KZZ51379.1 pirin [Oleiphilus sp. HI0122]KZZ76333.1 pirin [Oleiphilus sp. HI0130]KZZ76811.1 pirin [Oleiphilus sp. HI0133]
MNYLRRNEERGQANFGWLDSKHSFSFGHYYDPQHMGVSVLRVINDDTVAPGAGFDTHGHQNMEIISYVLEGTIEHKDSTGNHYQIPAGEVQRMSAGTGVTHSEHNASKEAPLKFLQIWIQPEVQNIEPSYEQRAIEQNTALTPLVTPDGEGDSLHVHQDARIYRLRLATDETATLTSRGNHSYLHVIKGSAEFQFNDATTTLKAGDALGGAIASTDHVQAQANSDDFEALWFELP